MVEGTLFQENTGFPYTSNQYPVLIHGSFSVVGEVILLLSCHQFVQTEAAAQSRAQSTCDHCAAASPAEPLPEDRL